MGKERVAKITWDIATTGIVTCMASLSLDAQRRRVWHGVPQVSCVCDVHTSKRWTEGKLQCAPLA
jgi:hypothetical protein